MGPEENGDSLASEGEKTEGMILPQQTWLRNPAPQFHLTSDQCQDPLLS